MSNRRVLELYKKLHKISKEVFTGDSRALTEANRRIELEFKKNKFLQKPEEIEEKIKIGEDVANIMKTQLVQMVCKNPETNSYELKLRKETAKLDNVIFKENAILPQPRSKKCS